jgi:uncharacterized protein (TIGR02391 family)
LIFADVYDNNLYHIRIGGMMKLVDLIPDPDALLALEPDELGLRLLPVLAAWRNQGTQLQPSNFIPSIVGHPQYPQSPSQYPVNRRPEIEQALREAWAWLEGQALLVFDPGWMGPHEIRKLSRRAQRLVAEPDVRRAFTFRRIPKESLHPKIREDVWELFHRGKYDSAVLDAMKAVEVAVREAAGYGVSDYGLDMIVRAFHEEKGPLRDPNMPTAERMARRALFAGAYGSYRNPHSHREIGLDDPDETAEIIMLACHLLRIVDTRKAAGVTP